MATQFLIDYARIRTQCETLLSGAFTPAVWSAEATVSTNDLIKPTALKLTGQYYRAMNAGKLGATEPTWPTAFQSTVVDGAVTFRAEEPVYVLDSMPDDLSYPYLRIRDLTNLPDVQAAIGNVPASGLFLQVMITAHQGAAFYKTYAQTRIQTYEILRQVQNVIRNNALLGQTEAAFFGVISARAGLFTIQEDLLPTEYGVSQAWIIRVFSRKAD